MKLVIEIETDRLKWSEVVHVIKHIAWIISRQGEQFKQTNQTRTICMHGPYREVGTWSHEISSDSTPFDIRGKGPDV